MPKVRDGVGHTNCYRCGSPLIQRICTNMRCQMDNTHVMNHVVPESKPKPDKPVYWLDRLLLRLFP